MSEDSKIFDAVLFSKTWQRNIYGICNTGIPWESFSFFVVFSARCNIYISRLCYDVRVRLSVTEVHWHIIANSNSDPTLPRIAAAMLLAGGSSRAMLASARVSCFVFTLLYVCICVYICNSIRASVSGLLDPSCSVVSFNH